jgi:hypothetical protein
VITDGLVITEAAGGLGSRVELFADIRRDARLEGCSIREFANRYHVRRRTVRVGIRIEPATLMFYDLATRELLRTRKNPLTPGQVKGLRGVRPRRASATPVR